VNSLQRDLSALLGDSALRTGSNEAEYLHDSTEMQGLRGHADAVVAPADVAGVQALVRWCYEREVPIVPRGGGTGFAGGAVPFGGVVCSLERLDRVRAFEPELWRMHVDAGVTTGRVQKLARESGVYYPPDPGAVEQSQIGGNIACNAGGPHSFKYGVTRAWLTGVEAVIAEGELVRFGGRVRKDVAGYDLCSLLTGSEGTLGVVTGAWLRLIPAPELSVSIAAVYASPAAGVAALERVVRSGLLPAALEFFDQGCVAASAAAFPSGLPENAAFLVLAEADGSPEAVSRLLDELDEALEPDALTVRRFETAASQRELWRWRSGVSFAVAARRGGKMSEDVAVPFEALGQAIEATVEIGRRHGLEACSWGHAGDGNLHATFLIDARSDAEVQRAVAAHEELFGRALELGGTVSGEHGLGWVKRGQFERRFSAVEVQLQRQIKAAFDPKGLFNPGKKLG
jgi:glycolate oxidase subunit GlcD